MLRKLFLLTFVIFFGLTAYSAESWIGNSVYQPFRHEIISDTESGTTIKVNFSGIYHKTDENGESLFSVDGKNFGSQPSFTRLVKVPAYRNISVRLVDKEYVEVDYNHVIKESLKSVDVGQPAIMRDLRVVPLTVNLLTKSDTPGKAKLLKSARIELEYEGFSTVNNKDYAGPTSEAFAELYRSSIMNYDGKDEIIYGTGKGTYLIISPQEYANGMLVPAFDDFVEWKTMKGYNIEVFTFSGHADSSDVATVIHEQYYNADPPLEYVLLLGDEDQGSTIASCNIEKPGGGEIDPTDHPYTMIEGDDYFSDVFIGRISVANITHVQIILNKIVRYEKLPFMGQTNWYTSMLAVAGNYSDSGIFPITPVQTAWWMADYFLLNGYTEADTIFNWVGGQPPGYPATNDIISSINSGKGFVMYRGWASYYGWQYPVFNISHLPQLINGWKLPVVCSFVCQTGNFRENCIGEEFLRTGSVGSGNGAVAFFGPTDLYTNTNYNNAISAGFCEGFLDQNLSHLGAAAAYGKHTLLEAFQQAEQDTFVQFYFKIYTLLGDPEMQPWRNVPKNMVMDCPTSVPNGANSIEVSVTYNGNPLQNAYVTALLDGELVEGRYTESDGTALLTFEPGAAELQVACTKYGYIPQIVSVSQTSEEFVGYNSHVLQNQTNPASDYLNPGETADLAVTLKNFGSNSQNNVSGVLSTANPYININTANYNFGSIASNGTATGTYSIECSNDAPTMSAIDFTLDVTASGGDYESKFSVFLEGIDMIVQGVNLPGGNFNPGAQGDIEVILENIGQITAEGVAADLSSFDESVTIIDGNTDFGNIPPGGTAVNTGDPFIVLANSGAFESRVVQMRLDIYPSTGAHQTLFFDLTIGTPSSDDPTGPDAYGYFAYDDTDTGYLQNPPVYDWVELDPNYPNAVGGATLIELADDAIERISLPFDFVFYGDSYDEVTICTNGWIAFEDTWSTMFRNWDIPSPLGPRAMIMPFWDDLKDTTDQLADIYYWEDVANGRFIIEWSRIPNRFTNAPEIMETFQVILYDPSVQSGPTGDGDILFQYYEVNDVDEVNNYCTVGVQDYMHERALEYIYARKYDTHPTAAELEDGRAILITTQAPDNYLGINDGDEIVPGRYSLEQNYPNPFNPSTTISFEIARDGFTELKIFDINGRLVKTVYAGELSVGNHTKIWDGRNDAGSTVPSGIYLIKLKSGNFSKSVKSVLIK